jgi:hypothetical protein
LLEDIWSILVELYYIYVYSDYFTNTGHYDNNWHKNMTACIGIHYDVFHDIRMLVQ